MSLFSSGKEWYEYVKVQYEIKKDLEESHNLVIFPLPNLYYDTVEKKKKIKPPLGWSSLRLEDTKKITNLKAVPYYGKTKYSKGLGILCGDVSDVMILDIDNEDLLDELNIRQVLDEFTPIVKTRKGYHIYFRYDPNYTKKTKITYNGKKYDIDILTENKRFGILPPTKYRIGDEIYEYKWVDDKDFDNCELMDMPPYITEIIKEHNKNNTKSKRSKQKSTISKEYSFKNKLTNTCYDSIKDKQLVYILENLPSKYYDDYEEWFKVLLALKNTSPLLLEIGRKFSKKSKSYTYYNDGTKKDNPDEQYDYFWENQIPKDSDYEDKLTVGSLIYWLSQENPEAYSNLSHSPVFELTDTMKHVSKLDDIIILDTNKSGYNLEAKGNCMGCNSASNKFRIYIIDDSKKNYKSIIMNCENCSSSFGMNKGGKHFCGLYKPDILGKLLSYYNIQTNDILINRDNVVYFSSTPTATFDLTSGKFVSDDQTSFLQEILPINIINKDFSDMYPFNYNVSPCKWSIVGRQERLYVVGDDGTSPKIDITDYINCIKEEIVCSVAPFMKKNPFAIKRKDAKQMIEHILTTINRYLKNDIGMTLNITINNTYINNDQGYGWTEVKAMKLLEERQLLNDYIVKSSNTVYKFNVRKSIWEPKERDKHMMEVGRSLLELFTTECRDVINDINDSFFTTSASYTKMYNMLISNEIRCENDHERVKLLDANVYLFPFKNLVYDLKNDILRKIEKEDYITTTTEYDIRPIDEIPSTEFDKIYKFYNTILPIREEREFFKNLVASCLPKSSKEKILVILTDRREGNNAKSTLMESISDVFGKLSVKGNFSLLTDQTNSLNGHDAAYFQYKDKRLTYIDETDNNKVISSQRTKMLTSGGKNKISGRRFMSGEYEEFQWTATPFVNCNDGEFAKLNGSDSALLNRLKVVPFRSKFLPNIKDKPKDNLYCIDYGFIEEIFELKDVHFYYLLDAYRIYKSKGIIEEPEYSKVYKESLVVASDSELSAICEFVEEVCEFTDKSDKYIRRIELLNLLQKICPKIYDGGKGKQRIIAKLNKCMMIKGIEIKKKTEDNQQFKDACFGISLKKKYEDILNGYEHILFSR